MKKHTYREIIATIQESFNSTTKDTYIPRRLILSMIKLIAEDYISKKFNDKSLFREINLLDWIECIELKKEEVIKCKDLTLPNCEFVMMSEICLPNLIWHRFGSSVVMVTNVDKSVEYKIITESDYQKIRKQRFFDKFKGKYAIITSDNRLYIPDSEVERVSVLLYTLDENKLSACGCCDNDECLSFWDVEVKIPDKLLNVIVDTVVQKLTVRLQVPKDENPNMDSNIKSQIV